MSHNLKSGLLIADFNISNFAAFLNNGAGDPPVRAVTAPFGQVLPVLLNPELPCWGSQSDFAVIWSRPEGVIPAFADLVRSGHLRQSEMERSVDDFCSAVLAASSRVEHVFVPAWVLPPIHQGNGILDLSAEGVSRALLRMNLRLFDGLDGASNIYKLNTQKWLQLCGEKSFDPRLWYLGKIAFGNDVCKSAAADIKAALRGLMGKARKLIVLDLDETLWGGIVGDVGWQNIRLGGHDQMGEAFVDFQRELKGLAQRGIILGIVSKNEEENALAAIDNHPEMILRRSDFAGWKINWSDKAANIAELAQQLNLGLDSIVFIDDNPVERARVRQSLPQVLVPEWPSDPRFFPQTLLRLDCFDKPSITQEDRERPQMYATERQRADLRSQVSSMDEWLKSLGVAVVAEPLEAANLTRAAQLLNKTNQLNLSTRRMSEAELSAWATDPSRCCWVLRVSDKFGDSGLTGLLSVESRGLDAQIVDFVLSCRVMGRKVEECMLKIAVDWARSVGAKELVAVYEPTLKNKPCLDFFEHSGFCSSSRHRFHWILSKDYPDCSNIQLTVRGNETKSFDSPEREVLRR